MFRVANLVMVVALLVTAAVVYQVKYASTADAERLAHLRQAIRAERDAIAVMRAEWARRTSPLYVQGLVQRHLDLQVLSVDAMSTLDDLPEKPAGGGDGLGGLIEALSDAPLVTSSVGKPERASTSSASTSSSSSSSPSSSSSSSTGGGAAVLPATSALRPASAPVSAPKPPPAPSASAAPRPAVTPRPASQPGLAMSEPASVPTPPPPAASPVEGLVRGIGSFFGPVVPSSGH